MANITHKDIQIILQSQSKLAIEIVDLVGFPTNILTNKDKVNYIVNELAPYLTKNLINNTVKIENDLKQGVEKWNSTKQWWEHSA